MVTQPRRGPTAALVAASLGLVLFMTLRPVQTLVVTPTFCIFCGTLGGVDFALNVVLFVPLGIGLRWVLGQWKAAAITGAVTTLVIETLQWRLIPGRDASLGDLVANTLGTMLGTWIAMEGLRWLNATSAAARRYAAAFGIIAAVVVGGSAWLLQPVRLRYPQWVQWTPPRPNMDRFQGRLLAVELNDRLIHPTEILPANQAMDSLTRGVSVRARIGAPAPPTGRQAIIVRIANDLEEGFFLAQWNEAVVFRTHIAAVRLKLRPILVGLDDAFPDSVEAVAAGEFTIEGSSNPQAIGLRRQRPGHEASVTLRRTVGLAWALLLPWDVALRPPWWVVNAFWLGALVLPVSFFTIRSGVRADADSGRGISWWPLPLALATLVATPGTGLSALGLGEWVGVLAGISAGWLLERWSAWIDRRDLKARAHHGTIPT